MVSYKTDQYIACVIIKIYFSFIEAAENPVGR